MLYGQKRTGTFNLIKEWIRMLDGEKKERKKERNTSRLPIRGSYRRRLQTLTNLVMNLQVP
jgi:hypothetical protein